MLILRTAFTGLLTETLDKNVNSLVNLKSMKWKKMKISETVIGKPKVHDLKFHGYTVHQQYPTL